MESNDISFIQERINDFLKVNLENLDNLKKCLLSLKNNNFSSLDAVYDTKRILLKLLTMHGMSMLLTACINELNENIEILNYEIFNGHEE